MNESLSSVEALNTLRSFGRERHFRARETILARGDSGNSLAIIEAGVVRISLFGHDGRELALALMGPGEVVGELSAIDGKERAADVIAAGEVKTTWIPGSDLQHLLRTNTEVMDYFFRLLCQRIRSTNEHTESQALQSLAGRLSLYFINNGIEEDDGSLLLLNPPSQTELARLIGGARESVNRQFRIWRDAGLIVSEKQGYRVPDPVRLQENAMAV